MEKEKKIIIVADDFGISQKANDTILELVRLKKLSRVAIMADGLISLVERDLLLTSDIKLDIHLNLNKLNPKNNERKFEKGVLERSFSFLFLYFTGKVDAVSAEISWEKQIEKFEEIFGRKPDGINSHEHTHFFPAYFKIALKLCKKYNIDYLRFGKNKFPKNFHPICFILNMLRLNNLKKFSQSELSTSDFLVSLDWIKDTEKFLQKTPVGTTEIVCHPERDVEFEIIKKYF